jgi:hypothetical protein
LKEIRLRALWRRFTLQHNITIVWKEICARKPPFIDAPQHCKETRIAWP